MGSSYAAGPGIRPRSPGSPRLAGRSARNYAHLLAGALDLSLTDVTYSGATTVGMTTGHRGRTAQVDAVTSHTRLVTLTCGGNDVGYLPRLTFASLPRPLHTLADRRVRTLGDRTDAAFADLPTSLDRLLDAIAQRAPAATVVVVDYLTLLPAEATAPTPGMPADIAAWGRDTADRLAEATRAAAERHGATHVSASTASRDHHAWSPDPWTSGFHLSLRHGAPYHPNAAGMQAVADLIRPTLTR
jgi:lysophospholipase L1-like esterase